MPSGNGFDQPTHVFRAYNILSLSTLRLTRKINLRPFATTRNGILYVRRPALQRLWIPMRSLPSSARATATAMVTFLKKLQAGRHSMAAVTSAATIIVEQFKRDLHEMGVVQDFHLFDGAASSVCIRDAQTVEYASRVFVPDNLLSRMSTRAFLGTALDLFNPSELHNKITECLLRGTRMVPCATVHVRQAHFSSSLSTILIRGP